MKAIPTIQKYMTTMPHTVGAEQTLTKAEGFMREYKIRHLPVLKGGKLVGILTDRDIALVESLSGVDPKKITVDEAFSPEPYFTTPDAKLDEVVSIMAEKKYGCVLVQDNKKLVGIFTWVDALNAMSELLNQRFHK